MSPMVPPASLFLEAAPYEKFELGIRGHVDLVQLQFYQGTLDTHCVQCDRDSVFKSAARPLEAADGRRTQPQAIAVDAILDGKTFFCFPFESGLKSFGEHHLMLDQAEVLLRAERFFSVPFVCTRQRDHALVFYFRVAKTSVEKVGQWPSVADLQTPGIKKYRRLLGHEKYQELSRAIGLHAHGVGIGAFVYLRRIFEDLIESARREAAKDSVWDDGAFTRSRMDEKIKLLSGHLPRFLVENRGLYSILSVGVHELTEVQCLAIFAPVRVGIELILDERLAEIERQQKIAGTAKELAAIKGQVGKGGSRS